MDPHCLCLPDVLEVGQFEALLTSGERFGSIRFLLVHSSLHAPAMSARDSLLGMLLSLSLGERRPTQVHPPDLTPQRGRQRFYISNI